MLRMIHDWLWYNFENEMSNSYALSLSDEILGLLFICEKKNETDSLILTNVSVNISNLQGIMNALSISNSLEIMSLLSLSSLLLLNAYNLFKFRVDFQRANFS